MASSVISSTELWQLLQYGPGCPRHTERKNWHRTGGGRPCQYRTLTCCWANRRKLGETSRSSQRKFSRLTLFCANALLKLSSHVPTESPANVVHRITLLTMNLASEWLEGREITTSWHYTWQARFPFKPPPLQFRLHQNLRRTASRRLKMTSLASFEKFPREIRDDIYRALLCKEILHKASLYLACYITIATMQF